MRSNLHAATPARSLGLRAFVYVIAVCLAIIAVEGWREWGGYQAALQRTEIETRNLAGYVSQHAEDTYEIAEQAVNLVAFELSEHGLGADGIALAGEFMKRTVETSGRLRGLHLLGPDGRVIATTASNLPPDEDRSGHAYFRYHRATPGSAARTGPPIYARDGGMEIPISRRLDDAGGRFAGVIVATIDTQYFARVYREIDLGQHGVAILLDADGMLLSRQPYRPELVGHDMGANAPNISTASGSGSYHYRSTVDGVERIAGWERNAAFPVLAIVAISRDEALATWSQGLLLRSLVTLALTLVVAILGLRLADQVYRRQKSEAVLVQKEAEFRLLAESASDLVLRFDGAGNRTYISPAAERVLGYTPDELIGKNAFDIINDEDRPAAEAAAARLRTGVSEQETVTYRRRRKDGVEVWFETSLRSTTDSAGQFSVVGVTRDITERKQLELQLERMALRDGLTGLANRRAFDAALTREVARTQRTGAPLSLLMIDADRFKRFNDDNGHLAGDTCLKAIAAVVSQAARRPTDLAARYGGEEMVLLLPETDLAAAHAIAADITRQVQALTIPHERNPPWKLVTVSVGTASIDPVDVDAVYDGAWLVRAADLALYDAKAHGRNQSIAARQNRRTQMVG